MEIFLVENDADEDIREKLAQLMMGQMEAIGDQDAYSRLVIAIDLALVAGSSAKIFAIEEEDQIIALAFLKYRYRFRKRWSIYLVK